MPVVIKRQWQRRLLVLVCAALLAGVQAWRGCPEQSRVAPLEAGEFHVKRVVDGDTLLLDDGARVRLIGVNAPETVKPDHPVEPWGPEASQFTHEFLRQHAARLEFDREKLDQYHRYLAYVWVGDKMLNEELVRAGLARWEPQYHYSQAMKTRFRKAQREAQAAHRGIWSGE